MTGGAVLLCEQPLAAAGVAVICEELRGPNIADDAAHLVVTQSRRRLQHLGSVIPHSGRNAGECAPREPALERELTMVAIAHPLKTNKVFPASGEDSADTADPLGMCGRF